MRDHRVFEYDISRDDNICNIAGVTIRCGPPAENEIFSSWYSIIESP